MIFEVCPQFEFEIVFQLLKTREILRGSSFLRMIPETERCIVRAKTRDADSVNLYGGAEGEYIQIARTMV